ncbi:MAG: energy-coupled thiamine transporter ThiT [Lachnospiraceae bacterium]
MDNFFAAPTDEWGDNAVRLTTAGVTTIAAIILVLVVAALLIGRHKKDEKLITTKQLVYSAVAIALAMVTSMIKVFALPTGGAVTLLSMLFVVLIAYWYGPAIGILTGVAYGLLQFVLEPIFYTIPQMLVDYPLAFGALGLAGFFYKAKNGLTIGYILGVLGRYFFAFLSGVIFFGMYAPEGMGVAVYSLLYNGSYLIPEAVITLIIINIPPVKHALTQLKKSATENHRN